MTCSSSPARNPHPRSRSKAAMRRLPSLLVLLAVPLLETAAHADHPLPLSPDLGSLARYAACSAEAEERVLPYLEAQACSHHYISLKLSFLPDVTLDLYRSMTASERAIINRQGYHAYHSWRSVRPERHAATISGSVDHSDPDGRERLVFEETKE